MAVFGKYAFSLNYPRECIHKRKVACPRPVSQLEKDTFVSWWDPGNPTFFDGFRFAEVLLNRETAFGPLGFGGFRALSDFRVRGVPRALEGWVARGP